MTDKLNQVQAELRDFMGVMEGLPSLVLAHVGPGLTAALREYLEQAGAPETLTEAASGHVAAVVHAATASMASFQFLCQWLQAHDREEEADYLLGTFEDGVAEYKRLITLITQAQEEDEDD